MLVERVKSRGEWFRVDDSHLSIIVTHKYDIIIFFI